MVIKNNTAIHKRQSYARWKALAEFLEAQPTTQEILREVHRLLDSMNAYGSITQSGYSNQSLHYVIDEMKANAAPKRLAYRFILASLDDFQWGTMQLTADLEIYLDVEHDIQNPDVVGQVCGEVKKLMAHFEKVIGELTEDPRCYDCHAYPECEGCEVAEEYEDGGED